MKIFDNFISKEKRRVKNLIRGYEEILAVDKIMEVWVTKRIVEGQHGRRDELLKLQSKIGEQVAFLEYLHNFLKPPK